MKQLPSLPSLNSNQNRKHSQSRDSVKLIQTKINQHQNQITRNQKVIISIANDFRLLKQQLQIKVKENEQLSEMYRKSVDQNQKLAKITKQMKATIAKLEKSIEQKDRLFLSTSNRPEEQKQKEKAAQKQMIIIDQLNNQIGSKNKQIKVLEQNNHQILKQYDKLKEQFVKIKKTNDEMVKNKSNDIEQKTKILNSIIEKLTLQKQNKQKQIKEKQQQIKKNRDYLKDRERLLRENKKYEQEIKSIKLSYEKSVEQNKRRRDRMNQLQQKIKGLQIQLSKESSLAGQIKILQQKQKQSKQKLTISEQKIKSLNSQVRQLTVDRQTKKKLQIKLKKLTKTKAQINKTLQTIKLSIKCELCSKVADKPVTCIPCGHSFCLECKKGYQKQCKKCVNVKRQAVYRNQLLDEIIQSYDKIRVISQLIQLAQ